jgi:hypothetical protein
MPLNVDKISTGSLSVNGTDITGNAPYKVYTALLTQSGGDSDAGLIDNGIVVGVTYRITPYGNEIGVDFTNIGAPNNNAGTYFVATGITPNSWGINTDDSWVLQYNTGAPVVTVLENTIGNIWFTYIEPGNYETNSNNLFTLNKTLSLSERNPLNSGIFLSGTSIDRITIQTFDEGFQTDTAPLQNGSTNVIEIRVYN